jgi:hypothetical protein
MSKSMKKKFDFVNITGNAFRIQHLHWWPDW